MTCNYLEHIEKGLDAWLPEIVEPPGLLNEAMRYSIFAGGKRLRPRLTMASCEALGGDPTQALAPAVALEMIHTYSLIHDDLPSMDDDDMRRGRPTNHKMFGEDMAVLAGDALLTQAFTVIATHCPQPEWVPELTRVVAHRAGWAGMVGGQVADIKSENKTGSLELLKFIHLRKTAALISATFECGAICAQADDVTRNRYAQAGETLGLAFQIMDDILDCTANSETLGKTAGKDAEQNKITYPSVVGIERARKMATALEKEVLDSLESEGDLASTLRSLVTQCVKRDN